MGDIVLKINQGTGRLTGRPLCYTCSHAIVRKTCREDKITCGYDHPAVWITEPVLDCSEYRNKTLPSKRDFEELAWTIDVNKRQAGFVQSVEIKPPTKEEQ